MALPVTITGINTAVAPVGPFKLAAGNYTSLGITTGATIASLQALRGTGATTALAQTFTNGASAMTIASITLNGSKNQSPTDNLYIEITATDANGAVLGTSDLFPCTSLPFTSGAITITFSTPVTISASATFGVVIRRQTVDTTNYPTIVAGSSSTYAGGSYFISDGSTWTDQAIDLYCVINKQVTIASDAFYFFGRDSTTATTLRAMKATAPDASWASIATKTGFTTAILYLAAYQVGPIIHLLVQDGTASTSLATKYVSFDMTNDTFLTTTETVSAAVAVTGQVAGVGAAASLVVRSNGEVVAFYNGVQTKTSGTFRARVYYRRRTGVNTYGAETQVDPVAAIDNTTPIAALGAADRVHFIWSAAANTGYRTLSAGNALNTAGSSASLSPPGDGCSYDRSGTTKVVVTSNGSGQSTMRFDSSDNPTPSFANQSIAAASIPHRIGADGTDVTIVYRSTADSDLYAIKSSDDGATFGAPVSFFVGTVASADVNVSRNASGGVYQRGSNVVVGYVVNDNGTLKYNEYVLRVLGPPDQTLTPAKFTDGDTFLLPPIVAAGDVGMTPSLFTDADTFLLPPVVTAPGPTQTLTPTLFTDSDTLYMPTITALAPPQTIAPNAQFLNTQLFFTPTATVTTSNTLTPSLYTDPDSFPSPHTLTSTYTLTPTTYTDLDNFFGGRIDFGLNTTLYTDADNFFVPTVQVGAMGVVPPLYTDPDSFYGADISISGGIQTLTPALFTDPDTVYGGALTSNYSLTPTLFSDPDNLYGPTVSVGAVTVAPTRFDNSQTFFAPVVSGGGDVVLSVARYDDPDTFFSSSITVGASTLTPARYDDSDGFFAPSVSAGAATVVLAFLNDPDSFPAATVGAGAITLTPLRFTDPDNVFAPSLSVGAVTVLPTLFSDPDGFFVHGVVPGSTVLLPPLYGDPDVFFGGSIVGGIQIGGGGAFVSPPFIANVGSMMIRS